MVYKGLNSLLLLKVQGEERMADLAKFLLRLTIVKVAPETLQLEESTGGETHNGNSSGAKVGMDETAFATLSYYMVSEMPGTLAIVRYHSRDDHDQNNSRAEDTILPKTFVVYRTMSRTALLPLLVDYLVTNLKRAEARSTTRMATRGRAVSLDGTTTT